MKKTTFVLIMLSFSLFTINSLNAQNDKKVKLNRMEKKLVGTWELIAVEYVDIDEFVQTYFNIQYEIFDAQLEQLYAQIKVVENEDEKEIIQHQINELKEKIAEFTKENLTTELNKELQNNLNDGFILSFKKDKTYKSITLENEGTWYIDNNKSKLHITIGENSEQIMTIKK